MLNFFRKHQKILFLFTTIIIVFSFIFFGTYQAIAPGMNKGGEEETSYVSQMVQFLDTEQWMVSNDFFAANFLNEGVLSKEFLETGIGDLLAAASPESYTQEFSERLKREKNYTPYTHPFLPALSAMSLWSVFAPDLPGKLKAHQEGDGSFPLRRALFLAQKSFPPSYLAQILRYQEQRQANFPPDPRLSKNELCVFGYSKLSDWFGERYIETLANVIIEKAAEARKLGYRVTQEEVLADLLSRSQANFNQLKQQLATLPIEDGYGLFRGYLNKIGIREKTALKIWEDVTLFRRLMHAIGDSALTDPLPLSEFYSFAYENATLELYQMPASLYLKGRDELKKLEVYLAAVGEKKANALDIPLEFAPLETIESRAPELVGKRYSLYCAETSKNALQSKVSVKETFQWECDLDNWKNLQHHFPELAYKTGDPFTILEALEEKSRKLVDAFARKQIVEKHPEWIKEALTEAELEEKHLFLNVKSEVPFAGITDIEHLIVCLEDQGELPCYSQDNDHFYRFLLNEKGEKKEILTYQEALKSCILEKLDERMNGEALTLAVIQEIPSTYKKEPHLYRYASHLIKYKENVPEGSRLAAQFKPEKKEKTITRSEKSFISLDEVFALEPGTFSPIKIDPKEGAYLYRFIEKKTDKSLPLEKMVQAQDMLSKEARLRYFEACLKK